MEISSLTTTRNFFDDAAGSWDEIYNEVELLRLQQIFDSEVPSFCGPVLDLGCGTGVLLPFISANLKSDSTIAEFDISFRMLERVSKGNGKKISRIEGDGHFLPFKDQQFGSVLCFSVFPHFSDQDKVIREAYRTLQPGGYFLIIHLLDHIGLNECHRRIGGTVSQDIMPACYELVNALIIEGFEITRWDENPDKYLLIARKQ